MPGDFSDPKEQLMFSKTKDFKIDNLKSCRLTFESSLLPKREIDVNKGFAEVPGLNERKSFIHY